MYKLNNKYFSLNVMLEWQIICHFSTKYSKSHVRYVYFSSFFLDSTSILVLFINYICDFLKNITFEI